MTKLAWKRGPDREERYAGLHPQRSSIRVDSYHERSKPGVVWGNDSPKPGAEEEGSRYRSCSTSDLEVTQIEECSSSFDCYTDQNSL